jgi:tetratricopeptide (TPR) repeat protein
VVKGRSERDRETVPASEVRTPDAEPSACDKECFANGAFVGGRYRIVRFIARGGMGEVYEAFDEELRVRVALKVATRTSGRSLDRFKREVLLARRVTHRNVCRLFEIGFETIDGKEIPYCTMELLEGTTLSARLADGPLAIVDARAIVHQIATGLQSAHDVGVIHRDFKSSNILLVPDDDGRERAVISDFGLARAETGGDADGGSMLTNEQALLGTPAYMAPEQVECKPATAATDIYALGIVMFELATGELPFRAETPMATATLRLKQPAPAARSRRPELSASWDRTIARCLEIEPAKRFARAADVAAALDERVPARRTALWVIAAAIAVVLPVAGWFAFRAPRPTGELPPASADGTRTIVVFDPTDVQAWRATALGELLRAELRVPGRLRIVDGDASAALARDLSPDRLGPATPAHMLVTGAVVGDRLAVRIVDIRSEDEIASDSELLGGDLPAATARLGERLRKKLAGGDVTLDADHAAKVLPSERDAAHAYADGLSRARVLDHQGAIAALTHTTELSPNFGLAYLALHHELRAVRQRAKATAAASHAFELAGGLRSDQRLRAEAIYRESRKEWRLAIDLWTALLAVEPDDIDVASALSRSLASDHQIERCFEVLDQLRRRPPPIGDDPRLDLQEALCAREAGDFRRGLSAATRAEVKAGVRGTRGTQSSALAIEGEMLANAGEYERAVFVLDHAKQVTSEAGDREGVYEAIRQLAYVWSEQGKIPEAERAYREALEVARQMGDRIAEGITLNDYGQILSKPEAALAMFEDGLAIAREQEDDRLITALLLNVANKQDALGKIEEAIAAYREVIERAKAQQDDENLAIAQMNMGDSLVKLHRAREAEPLVEEALASFQKRDDENAIGYALTSRAFLRWGEGDLAGARKDFDAALAQRKRLGEKRNVATTEDNLARVELAEDHAAAAEPLARAALESRRKDDQPDRTAQSWITLARVQVELGHAHDALDAVAEAERADKPDDARAKEIALIRALAEPSKAADQLAIIRAHARDCPACEAEALLAEAEIERSAGHAARARVLLGQAQRNARSIHAEDLVARAALLLAPGR